MSHKYNEITKGISTQLAKMRKEMPEVMSGFSALAQASTKDGALDKKTRLIAIFWLLPLPWLHWFHSQTLVRLKHQRRVIKTLGMAIYMGGGPY